MYNLCIIVGENSSYGDMFEAMCSDIDTDNVIFFNKPFTKYDSFSNLFRRVLRKFKLYTFYECYYQLLKIIKRNKQKNIDVLFFSPGLRENYEKNFLIKIKRKYNVRIGILFVDMFGTPPTLRAESLLKEEALIDYAYTIEEEDALNNKFLRLCYTPYAPYGNIESTKKREIYFCGTVKDRGDLIENVIYKLQEKNIPMNIKLIVPDKEKYNHLDNVDGVYIKGYEQMLSYYQVLEDTRQTDILLDINAMGQTALSLRPYEAVVYNKRLLTNNKKIFEFKYYDERFMRYFTTLTTEDIEWIQNEVDVDYHYKGEFSINNIIKEIQM